MIDAPIREAQGTIPRILTLTSKAGIQLLFWPRLARPLLLFLAIAAEPSLLWIWPETDLRQREPWWHTNHQRHAYILGPENGSVSLRVFTGRPSGLARLWPCSVFFGVGLPIRQMIASSSRISKTARGNRPDLGPRPEETSEFFIKQELLPVTNYMPDIALIKKNGVKVFMAAGNMSLEKRRFYAKTAPILANLLNCEMVVLPGHHVSYLDMPEAWATVLRHILQKATE